MANIEELIAQAKRAKKVEDGKQDVYTFNARIKKPEDVQALSEGQALAKKLNVAHSHEDYLMFLNGIVVPILREMDASEPASK